MRSMPESAPRARHPRLAAPVAAGRGGVMLAAVTMLAAATFMARSGMDGREVEPVHAWLTMGGLAILGGAIGAAARHLDRANRRQETVRDRARAGATTRWEASR